MLKNVSAAAVKYGKEWAVWFVNWLIEFFKKLKSSIVSQYEAYFIRKDLSKEELSHQIRVIGILTKSILAFVTINVLRIAYRMVLVMLRKRRSKTAAA